MKTFRNLRVWQKAHGLVLEVYQASSQFPGEERYGVTQQIRRAAASVPTNIVEGYKRKSNREYAHFLNLADASLEETKYHVILARDLQYFSNGEGERLMDLCDEVGRMLSGLQKKVRPRET